MQCERTVNAGCESWMDAIGDWDGVCRLQSREKSESEKREGKTCIRRWPESRGWRLWEGAMTLGDLGRGIRSAQRAARSEG